MSKSIAPQNRGINCRSHPSAPNVSISHDEDFTTWKRAAMPTAAVPALTISLVAMATPVNQVANSE